MTENEQKISEIEVKLEEVRQRSGSNTHRLDSVEAEIKENRNLIIAIEKLATETKQMREELNTTIQRLSKLERDSISEDAEKWKKFTWYVFVTVLGICIGYIASKFGLK